MGKECYGMPATGPAPVTKGKGKSNKGAKGTKGKGKKPKGPAGY